MRIEFGKDILLETDEATATWTLKCRKANKKGVIAWVNEGWFSSIESACRYVVNLKACRSTSVHKDAASAVAELRSLWDKIHGQTQIGTKKAVAQ